MRQWKDIADNEEESAGAAFGEDVRLYDGQIYFRTEDGADSWESLDERIERKIAENVKLGAQER